MAHINSTHNLFTGDNGTVLWVIPTTKESLRSISLFQIVAVGLISLYAFNTITSLYGGVKAPFVGYRSRLEPGWLVRMRFSRGALPMITEGYSKFKDSMFKVSRNDKDILVISNKYVEELRALPDERISAIHSHIKNLLGKYSSTLILLESDLHSRILQQKLTPNLASFIPVIKTELDFALSVEVPACQDDWVQVQIYDILLRIVARISARVFIGDPACRNEEWLRTSIKYTENVFMTVMTLRLVSPFLHPILAFILPSAWRVQSNLRIAKRIIGPMVEERRQAAASGSDYQRPDDLLQWMIEAADENDGHPDKLAHRQLLLSLASIHTTTMSAAHALYDMCARPEYFEPIREELLQVMQQDNGWQKTTISKLRKMDSFLKESQRVNPPSLLAFNRVVREPLTLSDGVHLPVGTHFSVASDAVMHDPEFVKNPQEFDGFRYYRLRQQADAAQKHQFAMTDKNNLHFGHGKFSCPGRFFASNEIKIILAHLLLRYDFKYPSGQGRPANLPADENLYPDPAARLLMKGRKIEPGVAAII